MLKSVQCCALLLGTGAHQISTGTKKMDIEKLPVIKMVRKG